MKQLEITTRIGCSVQCKYCPQAVLIAEYSKRGGSYEMSFETYQECLDKVPSDVQIVFSGFCEPWLNPNATQMFLYAFKKSHSLRIYTTLEGMSEEDIDVLKELNIDIFSIHLPDEENNTGIMIDQEYLDKLDRLVTYRKSRGLNIKAKCQGTVHPRVKDIVEGVKLLTRIQNRAGNLKELPGNYKTGRITEPWCLRQNVLLPNGLVVLCCQDFGMKHVLGNLKEITYNDIFTSKEFRYIQEGLRNDNDVLCRSCFRV